MVYHLLNGDALAGRFPEKEFAGEIVSMREALIDGSLDGNNLDEFWLTRARHHETTIEDSHEKVVTEIEKIMSAPNHSEFNLWFGHDLFCQANMWFLLSLLNGTSTQKNIYAVYPAFLSPADIWQEYGNASSENLKTSFKNRIQFSNDDLELANNLWRAYKNHNLVELEELSYHSSPGFPYLRPTCKAHIDRFPGKNDKSRPELVVEDIIKNDTKDFYGVFEKFFQREGVYGFGDVQFKKIYDRVMDTMNP